MIFTKINNTLSDNSTYIKCYWLILNFSADRQLYEHPCLIDRSGVSPTRIGKIPPQLAALIQTNVNVQQLTVEAIATGKRDYVYHAAMMDPHTAAELSIDEIWKLTDEMIDAHGDMIAPLN